MSRVSRRVLLTATILLMPIAAHAQEAVMTGTVSDSTGGVLARRHDSPARSHGEHLCGGDRRARCLSIAGARGWCRITTERDFTTSLSGIRLLVGQTLVVNLEMAPSTIEETITVNAEAPLLKVDSSSLGGNIDRGRFRRCPCRDAVGCAAPARSGSHARATIPTGSIRGTPTIREFQANIDGQQFQNTMGGGGQPTFSQEMIAEFQFISNRFDATQGRSSGLQVNLVTKSGTNRYTGSFRSNFRDDRFNAADPVLERVTPFQNQQYASTFGGPILRDRLHFFAYTMRREPKEETWRTPYRLQRLARGHIQEEDWRNPYRLPALTADAVDVQAERGEDRHAVRRRRQAPRYSRGWENADQAAVQLTNVLSNRTLNELMVGHAGFLFGEENLTRWSNHWLAAGSPFGSITTGSPRITFTNFTIGGNAGAPRYAFRICIR